MKIKKLLKKYFFFNFNEFIPVNPSDNSIKVNYTFDELKKISDGIDGMLSEFSMTVLDSLLCYQNKSNFKGNIIEFGVYRGKSAAILAGRSSNNERLILADVEKYLDFEKIGALKQNFEFFHGQSEIFDRKFPRYSKLKNTARFIHVDSSHQYQTTFHELEMCEELLSDNGIVVLDDYTNLHYSQILPATFKYLYTKNSDLRVFLVTDEKAYLCRSKYYHHYLNYILRDIRQDMDSRGFTKICIARTDTDKEYRAFYIRPNSSQADDLFYGMNIYAHLYKEA